ncbi:MAG: hypothetical protein JWP25_8378, partial [Bradyrhizobium sp.]|nr:hypothetical protein [Bradyrhizobium sp.]
TSALRWRKRSILKVQLVHLERTGRVDCLTVSPAPRREATFVLRNKLPIPCTADEKFTCGASNEHEKGAEAGDDQRQHRRQDQLGADAAGRTRHLVIERP